MCNTFVNELRNSYCSNQIKIDNKSEGSQKYHGRYELFKVSNRLVFRDTSTCENTEMFDQTYFNDQRHFTVMFSRISSLLFNPRVFLLSKRKTRFCSDVCTPLTGSAWLIKIRLRSLKLYSFCCGGWKNILADIHDGKWQSLTQSIARKDHLNREGKSNLAKLWDLKTVDSNFSWTIV